ncbi:beta-lactamase family protein [Myxococcaceae bacterium JPH2]|nr:beta-lactamase family protein [Myxococcaceae bacterium JPH2]
MATRRASFSATVLAFTVSLLACHDASPGPEAPRCDPSPLSASLQSALRDAQAANPGNPGWLLAARIPAAGLELEEAVQAPGLEALSPRAPFRIASVTKTFMAAAILRLVERGQVSLDDTVAAVCPAPYPELLRAGGYAPERMTVAQLLTHTSGLFDYAQSDDYLATVFESPEHVWTREEQVRFAMEHGAPVGEPGAAYVYSDTGYLLLGALLEAKTGLGLAQAYRSLLGFERLGLQSTWLETQEAVPSAVMGAAPQAYDGVPLASIHASADLFGGGGLVSTAPDLARWFQALFAGQVFERASTLDTMLRVPATNESEGGAMGIFRVPRASGGPCWLHEGFWGAAVMTCPELNLTVAVTSLDASHQGDGGTALLRAAVQAAASCQTAH